MGSGRLQNRRRVVANGQDAVDALIKQMRQHISEMTATDVLTRLGEINIIDVREPDEVLLGYLPSAINVPRGVLEFRMSDALFHRGGTLLLYSNQGFRSVLAATTLQNMGYQYVLSLQGGYRAWCRLGYPIA